MDEGMRTVVHNEEGLVVGVLEWVGADPLEHARVVVDIQQVFINASLVNPWVKLFGNAHTTDELVIDSHF